MLAVGAVVKFQRRVSVASASPKKKSDQAKGKRPASARPSKQQSLSDTTEDKDESGTHVCCGKICWCIELITGGPKTVISFSVENKTGEMQGTQLYSCYTAR